MFDKSIINEVKKLLDKPKKIVLIAHKNPDGDTIGAVLGMYHYLTKKGHSVSLAVPNMYPEFYAWMPGAGNFLVFDREAVKVKAAFSEAEILFCLDFNAIHRTGSMSNLLKKAEGIKIMIDHHPDPTDEFDYIFSETDTSSTGELVYEFIADIGDGKLIDKNIAVCLYTSIMTDTGSFSFSCNRQRTYEVTARLIAYGVDANLVHQLVYSTFSENRLRLLGFALSERMTVWAGLHAAVIALTKKDLKKFGYQVGDTEGLVNYPLSMKHINLAVLITEKEDVLRLSFRSKGEFSVNKLAREWFEGGGHKNAAGGNSSLSMEQTLKKLKEVINSYKEELDYEMSYR